MAIIDNYTWPPSLNLNTIGEETIKDISEEDRRTRLNINTKRLANISTGAIDNRKFKRLNDISNKTKGATERYENRQARISNRQEWRQLKDNKRTTTAGDGTPLRYSRFWGRMVPAGQEYSIDETSSLYSPATTKKYGKMDEAFEKAEQASKNAKLGQVIGIGSNLIYDIFDTTEHESIGKMSLQAPTIYTNYIQKNLRPYIEAEENIKGISSAKRLAAREAGLTGYDAAGFVDETNALKEIATQKSTYITDIDTANRIAEAEGMTKQSLVNTEAENRASLIQMEAQMKQNELEMQKEQQRKTNIRNSIMQLANVGAGYAQSQIDLAAAKAIAYKEEKEKRGFDDLYDQDNDLETPPKTVKERNERTPVITPLERGNKEDTSGKLKPIGEGLGDGPAEYPEEIKPDKSNNNTPKTKIEEDVKEINKSMEEYAPEHKKALEKISGYKSISNDELAEIFKESTGLNSKKEKELYNEWKKQNEKDFAYIKDFKDWQIMRLATIAKDPSVKKRANDILIKMKYGKL